MKKANKIYISLIIIGFLTIMIGAFIKISTNIEADFILIIGMAVAIISILGFIFNNLGKIKKSLN